MTTTPADTNPNPVAVASTDFTPVGPQPLFEDESSIAAEMEAGEGREYDRRAEIYNQVTGNTLPSDQLGDGGS